MQQNKPWVVVLAIALFTAPMWLSEMKFGVAFDPNSAEASRTGWSHRTEIAHDLFERLNDERRARGLRELRWDDRLAEVASRWTEHMLVEDAYGHSTTAYRSAAGYPATGENILMGQRGARDAHVDWMLSDGHRANILGGGYVAVGIGAVCRHDGHLWATQVFGAVPLRAPPPPVDTGPEPIVRDDRGPDCRDAP